MKDSCHFHAQMVAREKMLVLKELDSASRQESSYCNKLFNTVEMCL